MDLGSRQVGWLEADSPPRPSGSDSSAFTILEKRQTFLEALFNPRPDRARTLLAKWRRPLDELMPFAVAHELGHALCKDVDEKRADEYGAQLRDSGTVRCLAR